MMKTMNDAYPNGKLGNGIFHDLQEFLVPWKSEDISEDLDIVYYSKSGKKYLSEMVDTVIDDSGLSAAYRRTIAKAIYKVFNRQWAKLYATLNFSYDPIENYRMIEVEQMQREDTLTKEESSTLERSGNNSVSNTGTLETESEKARENGIYGFNSSDSVGSDTSNETGTDTETRNLTTAESIDESESETLETNSDNATTENRSLTRSGNIGVTTSQQMIESERDLWQWNFFNNVFSDIDSILCLDIYGYCETEDD